MRKLFLFSFLGFSILNAFGQTTITMQKEGGVFFVPCVINGIKLKFIFDTGASEVSISLSEALFMLKNDFLSENDIIGSTYYQLANGKVSKGTQIVLRTFEVGGKMLYNVKAVIDHSLNAPLLLGQSALQKFGRFSVDYSTSTLTLGSSDNPYNYSSETGNSTAPVNSLEQVNLLFDFGEWGLRAESITALSTIIQIMKDNPSFVIEIETHSDSHEPRKFSPDSLSKRRAYSVKSYLVEMGIPSSRLVLKGYGIRKPRELNRDVGLFHKGDFLDDEFISKLNTEQSKEMAFQLNRRAEFKVLHY